VSVAVPALDEIAAAAIVDAAIDRHIAACRARVPAFIEQYFSVKGSLRLHGHAVGWDLARAPANLLLSVPQLGVQTLAAGLRRLGGARAAARLSRVDLLYRTAVAAELGRAVERDLLGLAADASGADGMALALSRDPTVAAALETLEISRLRRAQDPAFRAALDQALARYGNTRVAAAEIATALTSLGVGALAFKQLTPGLLSLGPALAGALAQSAAVSGFPLGASIGGLWYQWFPASVGTGLVAGVTGSLFLGAAMLTAFAGVVTDPAQKALGIHRRRLNKLIDGVEHALRTGNYLPFNPRDHYIARLVDLIDLARLAQRLAGG